MFPISQHPADIRQDKTWRLRALALEEENELLKVRAQKHELEILALKTTSAPVESNPEPESSQAPKKKRKVTQSAPKVPDRVDLRALVKDIRSGSRLPVLRDTLDILTSFRMVLLSDTNSAHELDVEKLLIPNIKRSLCALGKLLSAVLARDGSVVAASSRVDVLSCLCNLLLTLLDSTLPLAPREVILPHILGDIAMCVVRPIIRAFHAVSVREIAYSVKENGRKANDIDIRPDLLSILRRLVECLRTLKARTRDLREFMVFETAKEMEALWSMVPAGHERSREERMETLARKDSLWYQCSILHVALDRFPSSRMCEAGEDSFLSFEAVRVLANLTQYFERGSPVDEVAKGMVLGVLEKAWLSGLYESERPDYESCSQ